MVVITTIINYTKNMKNFLRIDIVGYGGEMVCIALIKKHLKNIASGADCVIRK